jgi:hypothetical protein
VVQVAVFKSRTDVALLQAQDLASRLESELEAAKKKYDTVSDASDVWRSQGCLHEAVSDISQEEL